MTHRAPIVQERLIAAPAARVFHAWRDPESLGRWMCPAADISCATVEVDFRVGGRFRIVMHGATRDYAHTGEYLEIDEPRRIVFTWISDFVPKDEARTLVTVSLEPLDEHRTRLRLVHAELPDTNTYDGHDGGWRIILARLAADLDTLDRRSP